MRVAVERESGRRREGPESKHAATEVGPPSSDPARQVLGAVRTAAHRHSRSFVDAAVAALENRANDPFEVNLEPPGLALQTDDLDSKDAGDRDADGEERLPLILPPASTVRPPDTDLLARRHQDTDLGGDPATPPPAVKSARPEAEADESPNLPQAARSAKTAAKKSDEALPPEPDSRDPRRRLEEQTRARAATARHRNIAKSEQALDRGPQVQPAKPDGKAIAKGPAPRRKTAAPVKPLKTAPAKAQKQKPAQDSGATGGGPVATWRSRVVAKANTIVAPEVGEGDRYVFQFQAASNKSAEQTPQKKLDLIASAREAVQPMEKFKDDELSLSVEDVRGAQADVVKKTKQTLEPQELPPLERSPLGTLPEIGTSVVIDEGGATHVRRETKPGQYTEILTAGPDGKVPEKAAWARDVEIRREDKKLDGKGSLVERVRQLNAKEPRNIDPKGEKAKGARISNDMPKQGPTVPTLDKLPKVDTIKVVAKILDNVEPSATSIANGARQAYPGGKEGLDEAFMSEFLPGIKADLIKEMASVAHACKESGNTLDERIRQETDKVNTATAQAKQKAEDAHAGAVNNEKLIADNINDHIGGLLDEIQQKLDDQAALAKGGFESKEVNAEKQRMLDDNARLVETYLGRYSTFRENRVKALGKERAKQENAYEAAVELDKKMLDARTPGDLDEKGKQKITDTKNKLDQWLSYHRLDLSKKVGPGNNTLIDIANTQIALMKKELIDAADAYEKEVKKWADKRLHKERHWWDELIDRIREWLGVAKDQKRAWGERSTANNQATCDQNQLDLDELIILQTKDMTEEEIAARKDLTETQKAMARSYFVAGPNHHDSVAALAAGLVESIRGQWQPRLGKMIEEKVLRSPFDKILKVAEASGMNPSAEARARQIYVRGFKGAGTHKNEVYEGLKGMTPVQAKALEITYERIYHRSLKLDISEELYDAGDQLTGSRQDYDQAMALLKGAPKGSDAYYESIAVQLNAAMKATAWGTGWGTDKETIFKLMRGKTAEERQAIKWAYKQKYGEDLDKAVDEELDDGFSLQYDSQRYAALSRGDTEAADAIAMRAAHGWQDSSTSSKLINWALYKDYKVADQVYQDLRADVEADAQAAAAAGHPWDSAEFDRQLKKRLDSLDKKFGDRYGADFNVKPGESALETAHQTMFSGPKAQVLKGERRNNFAMESAARIAIEHQAVILPDKDEVNKTLEAQYQRAYEEKRRDLEAKDLKDQQAAWRACTVKPKSNSEKDIKEAEKATEDKRKEWRKHWLDPIWKAEHRRALDRLAENQAKDAAVGKMRELKVEYEKDFPARSSTFSTGNFERDVYSATNVTWPGRRTVDNDKTRALLAGSGYLTPDQQLLFGVHGAGTDEKAVHMAYAGRSKEEIKEIHDNLQKRLAKLGITEDAVAWVLDDFSGDELIDVQVEQLGEAITPEQKSAVEHERVRLQMESTKGNATTDAIIGGVLLGPLGAAVGPSVLGGLREYVSRDETQYMQDSLARLDARIADLERKKKDLEAQGIHEGDEKWYDVLGPCYEKIDWATDEVKGAVAGQRAALDAAVSWATVGIQVVVGVASLVAGILLTPVTGGTSIAVTIAVLSALATTALTMAAKAALRGGGYGLEEAVSDAIVGVVDAIMAGVTAGYGSDILKGIGLGDKVKNVVGEFVRASVAHFVTGAAQAVPGALIGALINDGTIAGAFEQVLQGGLMSVAMGHVTEPITEHFQMKKALAARTSPAEFEKALKAFQQQEPEATPADLRRRLDQMLLGDHAPAWARAEAQKVLRGELLEGMAPAQREAFKNAKIELLSEEKFSRAGGAAASDTVRVVVTEKGLSVVVKAGSDLTVLGKTLEQFAPAKSKAAGVAKAPEVGHGSATVPRERAPVSEAVARETKAAAPVDEAVAAAEKPAAPKPDAVEATEKGGPPKPDAVESLEKGGPPKPEAVEPLEKGAAPGREAVATAEDAVPEPRTAEEARSPGGGQKPEPEAVAEPGRKNEVAPGERGMADETAAASERHHAELGDTQGRTTGREGGLGPEPTERFEPELKGGPGPEPKDAAGRRLALPEGELEPSIRKGMEKELQRLGAGREELRGLSDHELLERYIGAQAEQAPKRVAEFRSTLDPAAQQELDALQAAGHLHQEPVDIELAGRLQKALDTPIRLDPALPPGEIRVSLDGRAIHVGPGATLGDVLGHIPTVGALKRYQGAIGVVHRVVDAVGRVFGRGGPPFGTRAFEAWHEIQKLPGLVESRRALLFDRSLDVTSRLRLESEISRIESQLARHVGDLADFTAGRGYVAAEGEPLPTKWIERISEQEALQLIRTVVRDFIRQNVPRQASPEGRAWIARMTERAEAVLRGGPKPTSTKRAITGELPSFAPETPLDDVTLARYLRAHWAELPEGVLLHFGEAPSGGRVAVLEGPRPGNLTEGLDPHSLKGSGGTRYTHEGRTGSTKPSLLENLSNVPPQDLAAAMHALQTGGRVGPEFRGRIEALAELRGLLFDTEIHRDFRNLLFSAMAHDLLFTGQLNAAGRIVPFTLEDLVRLHPAAQLDAMSGLRQTISMARGLEPNLTWESYRLARSAAMQKLPPLEVAAIAGSESKFRQLELLRVWYVKNCSGTAMPELHQQLDAFLRRYYGVLP